MLHKNTVYAIPSKKKLLKALDAFLPIAVAVVGVIIIIT
jgi:hypothetical protein